MSKLEQAITALQEMQSTRIESGRAISPVCGIAVTVVYLVGMLSVPVYHVGMLLWFAVYPILVAPYFGMTFGGVFVRSLCVLPFVVFIGIFNPVFDTTPAITVVGVTVSRGWISFSSIILRGLMSVQAVIILIRSCSFEGVCRGLRQIGVLSLLVTQLLMVYRYLTVLLMELLSMNRARMSRSYGHRHLSLKMWGQMTGQLFLRTVARSERINRAMLARGFDGTMPRYHGDCCRARRGDLVFTIVWILAFGLFRFVNISSLLGFS